MICLHLFNRSDELRSKKSDGLTGLQYKGAFKSVCVFLRLCLISDNHSIRLTMRIRIIFHVRGSSCFTKFSPRFDELQETSSHWLQHCCFSVTVIQLTTELRGRPMSDRITGDCFTFSFFLSGFEMYSCETHNLTAGPKRNNKTWKGKAWKSCCTTVLITLICELNTAGTCAAVELPFMYFSRLNEEFVPLQQLRVRTIKCEKLHLIADTVVCESVGSLCQLF